MTAIIFDLGVFKGVKVVWLVLWLFQNVVYLQTLSFYHIFCCAIDMFGRFCGERVVKAF
jgi:hypothetical protein